jgi:hypothetical protein
MENYSITIWYPLNSLTIYYRNESNILFIYIKTVSSIFTKRKQKIGLVSKYENLF